MTSPRSFPGIAPSHTRVDGKSGNYMDACGSGSNRAHARRNNALLLVTPDERRSGAIRNPSTTAREFA
jgi:hypothetical protein